MDLGQKTCESVILQFQIPRLYPPRRSHGEGITSWSVTNTEMHCERGELRLFEARLIGI